MRVVFVGPPGSGKGTQARLLQERLGMRVIGTGEILREAVRQGTPVGHQVEPFLENGRLVPDHLVNDLVEELFENGSMPTKFVMDGYPRTVAQAEAFDKTLHAAGLDLCKAFVFVIDDDEVIRRLMSRHRDDDEEETIRRRMDLYHQNTDCLMAHYRRSGQLCEIAAVGDPEAIHKKIVGEIQTADR